MAFQVPTSKKSEKANRYQFTVEGTDYDVPMLKFAPVEAAELFEKGLQVAGMIACCDSDDAKDAIRSLDGDQFGALMDDWQEASGVEAGESSASSSS